MSRDVLILHGFRAKDMGTWLGWLSNKLTKKRFNVVFPSFPDPESPTITKRNREMAKHSFQPKGAVIVAHSIGCIYALYLIQRYKWKIEKLILTALPKNVVEGENLESLLNKISKNDQKLLTNFVEQKFDWSSIQKYVDSIELYFSTNDYAIPYEETLPYYKNLLPKAKIFSMKNKGHFNTKAGVVEFPEVLSSILGLE